MKFANKMRFNRLALASAALGGSLFITEHAGAALIVPGAAPMSTPGAFTFAGLTTIANESSTVTGFDLSGNSRYTATVQSEVLQAPGGTLDFAYQVTNISPAPEVDSLETVSVTSYRNFTTDVDYVSGTGNVNYATVGRLSVLQGITVTFNYTGANIIPVGDATDWMLIKTNATYYDNNGSTTLIDGATANVTTFEPAVPEPASISLLIAGATALLGRRPGRRSGTIGNGALV